MLNIWRIIKRVIDFYRDAWKVFLSLSVALMGFMVNAIIPLQNRWYMPIIAIPIALLALISLVYGIILWVKCYKDVKEKEAEKAKAQYNREHLPETWAKIAESIKRDAK